jgi:hypothetical protein
VFQENWGDSGGEIAAAAAAASTLPAALRVADIVKDRRSIALTYFKRELGVADTHGRHSRDTRIKCVMDSRAVALRYNHRLFSYVRQ